MSLLQSEPIKGIPCVRVVLGLRAPEGVMGSPSGPSAWHSAEHLSWLQRGLEGRQSGTGRDAGPSPAQPGSGAAPVSPSTRRSPVLPVRKLGVDAVARRGEARAHRLAHAGDPVAIHPQPVGPALTGVRRLQPSRVALRVQPVVRHGEGPVPIGRAARQPVHLGPVGIPERPHPADQGAAPVAEPHRLPERGDLQETPMEAPAVPGRVELLTGHRRQPVQPAAPVGEREDQPRSAALGGPGATRVATPRQRRHSRFPVSGSKAVIRWQPLRSWSKWATTRVRLSLMRPVNSS